MSSFFAKVFNSKKKCTNATKKTKKSYTCVGKKRYKMVPLTISNKSPQKRGNPSAKGTKRKRMQVSIRKRKNVRSLKRRKRNYYISSPSRTVSRVYTRRKRRIANMNLTNVRKDFDPIGTIIDKLSELKISNSKSNSNSNGLGIKKRRRRKRKSCRKR